VTARIKKLTLTSFRGATQKVEVTFDTTKPVALIFGENGTGKSTIGDALDFICNGHFGSLEDRSMSDQPKSHVASLGHDTNQLKVHLATTIGDFTGALSKNGPIVTPSVGCPEARILRRSNILGLLDAQPKARFDELKTFIAVAGIEKSEIALREAHRNAQADCNEAVRSSSQANDELVKLWNAEATPGKNALEWATSEVAKDVNALRDEVDEIGSLLPAVQAVESQLAALDLATTELENVRKAHAKAEDERKRAEAKHATRNAPLLTLLEDAKTYVARRESLLTCPVCEQGIDAENLLSRLTVRISEMSELSAATTVVTTAKKSVNAKESVVDQALKDFCQNAAKLGTALQASSLKEVVALKIVWADFDELLSHTEATDELGLKARALWKLALPCRDPVTSRKKSNQKSIAQKNAIKVHHDTHLEKLKSADTLASLAAKLKQALDVVNQKRKAYVEGILAAISVEVERLYTKLHPDEGIGKIRFYLKPNAIGSLEFDAQFQGANDIPPQAYYSESHLDTLGICVFLGLAKYFKTENTVIVLDDVVTSVDGPHLDRFMELLHDEAPNFNQVIITTHYRPWKDRYRYARGPAGKTQVIELRSWSMDTGVQTDEALSLVQELKGALSASKVDRQSVASKAGIQLENLLDFLTYQYRCKLPRQADANYTLGDLAGGVDSKLGKVLKVTKVPTAGGARTDVMLKALIDEVTAQTWVRNQAGCHFHSLGSEMSDTDIREFAAKVIALTEVIVCDNCKCFPTLRPSGSYWQCECGAVEMHPLIAPGAMLGTVIPEQ
jgi:hypothetical protein